MACKASLLRRRGSFETWKSTKGWAKKRREIVWKKIFFTGLSYIYNFTWLDNLWKYYRQIAHGAELAETRNMWKSLHNMQYFTQKIHQKKKLQESKLATSALVAHCYP